jgi:predicted nucleic acid-binding protein
MKRIYWDASALGKRYVAEIGSELVNRAFAVACDRGSFVLAIGIGEVVSVLVRKQNAGILSPAQAAAAIALLRADLSVDGGMRLESPAVPSMVQSWGLIEQHGVNATDALVLRSALDVANSLRPAGDELILATSDSRLVRAATVEGLATFDPGIGSEAQLDALLTT